MRLRLALGLALALMPVPSFCASASLPPGQAPASGNPILPGYYADPSLVSYQGKHYIYATLDPWGGDTLGCWESDDFKNWSYRDLNWPTKPACTSPTSKAAKVWAPSVIQARDGRFYMYVSVGSEVWVGVADHPLGPWRDAFGGRPLIPFDYKPGFHMIDAEAFIDDDGQAYLYWGSGMNWVNGRCWGVKLKPDMVTFDGEVRDMTPKRYFEAPFMVKRHGRYFLMNSTGKTTETTYAVEYAVGNSPFGPFIEGPGTPVLSSDPATRVLSPGHHAVFQADGRDYILYHRHSIPFDPRFVGRQVCVDEINFGADGRIGKITPTHEGPPFVRGRAEERSLAFGATASASSQASEHTSPAFAVDCNYATRWAAARDARGAWLQLDLGENRAFTRQLIRPEYAWKPCRFRIETSDDAQSWRLLADFSDKTIHGSPIVVETAGSARHLRLVFPDDMRGSDISIIEWSVF